MRIIALTAYQHMYMHDNLLIYTTENIIIYMYLWSTHRSNLASPNWVLNSSTPDSKLQLQ